jgi:hypothetical protein
MMNVLNILMQRIAEKLEFMKMRAVKVCTKAGVGRRPPNKIGG